MLPIAQLLGGIGLGIAAGAQCLETCDIVLPSYLASRESGTTVDARASAGGFCAGRLVGYLALTVIVTVIGALLPDTASMRSALQWITVAAAVALLASALLLRLHLQRLRLHIAYLAQRARTPLAAGLLSAPALCPPVAILLVRAMFWRGSLFGFALTAAFFAALCLMVVPLAGTGQLGRKPAVRELAEIVEIAVGVWYVAVGVAGLTG
jgi:hypothetical protein